MADTDNKTGRNAKGQFIKGHPCYTTKGQFEPGERRSEATEFKKGQIPWNKGTKGVMKAWNKGKECPQMRKPRSAPMTEEHKRHLSEALQGREAWNKGLKGWRAGSEHPNWKGGISKEEYGPGFDLSLKWRIRKRDGRICQMCGKTEKNHGKHLHVHHIDYVKTNNDPSNLIALCTSCHVRTNFDRARWLGLFRGRRVG